MVDKIKISDPIIRRLVHAVIDDLNKFYPDKSVRSLNKLHKGLCNRIGELWPQVGYKSREDFLNAYGFVSVRESNGGRPAVFDAEALLETLASRYKDAAKPKTIGALVQENPDLKPSIKTFSNTATTLYGTTAAKILRSRGILDGGKTSGDVSDEDIQAMLDALSAKYANAPTKPSSILKLKADNPEYEAAITAFSERGKEIYGSTPRKKLVELGIYPIPKNAVVDAETEEIEQAIDEVGGILCDLPADAKPRTIAALEQAFPKQGALIKSAKKSGLADKKFLQELGILAPTRDMIKEQGVRNVSCEKLLPDFLGVIGRSLIEPGDDMARYLPSYIAGIDAENKIELRTALVSVKGSPAKKMAVGETYSAKVLTRNDDWYGRYSVIQVSSEPPALSNDLDSENIFDGVVHNETSKLAKHEGATVVSVTECNGTHIAQLRYRYMTELRSETMIYILRQMGIVTEADIIGGMGWRFRMRKAIKENTNRA